MGMDLGKELIRFILVVFYVLPPSQSVYNFYIYPYIGILS